MPSVDERVVSMAFQNSQFEAGVAKTMGSLSKLDAALAKIGHANGLQDIEKAANKVTLQQPMSALDKLKARFSRAGDGAVGGFNQIERAGNHVTLDQPIRALDKVSAKAAGVGASAADGFKGIEKAANTDLSGASAAIDKIEAKFGALQIAGVTAFATIASKAAETLGNLGKKVTGVETMIEGYSDYELKIGATQTIMAGTGENIGNVTKYLKDLDIYADRTIYSLKDMTGNIGKFTNAGVKLPVAVDAMKGISNVAALSGANTNEAARAMYNLGQSIGQGTVRLLDWRSVELANMGTKEFKQELINSALAMGTLKKGSDGTIRSLKGNEVNTKNFTSTLQDQWLTADALTKTLSRYSDENTDLGKRAYAAATQVKTFSMMMTTLSAAAGTGWTDTFDIIIGTLPEAIKLWSGITNAVGGFIGKTADARNAVLQGWKDLGGRTMLLEALKNIFKAIFAILKPIGQAFRDIFPRKTAQDLFEMTKRFKEFSDGLKPSAATIENLRRTARGFFAVMHIGWSIVKGVVGVLGDLLGVVGSGSGGFLSFTGSIGDLLVALDNALTKGGLLKSFFDGLSTVLKLPLQLLGGIASAIFGLFEGADSGGADKVSGGLNKVKAAADPLAAVLDKLKHAWDGFKNVLSDAKDLVSPWLNTIGEQLSTLGSVIANAFKGDNFGKTMSGLQTAFIGGIFLAIRKAIKKGAGDFTGILKPLNQALGALTGNLKAMQQHVKAQIIVMIATAIGILAGAVFLLSKVDSAQLTKAMTAISVGMGQLVGAMAILGKAVKGPGMVAMPLVAASMVLLAGSMIVLGGAMKIFATMSWEELAKGLAGVAGGVLAMSVASKTIGPMGLAAGPGLILMALGMTALAGAVKAFATMSWEDLGKGLAGALGALVAIGGPLMLIGPEGAAMLLAVAPGLIGIAFGMNMLAGAVLAFGKMDSDTIIKGVAGAAGALLALGLAINAVPPHAILMAAGLVVVAIALNGIASAVKLFGSMSMGEIAKGLIAMGGALAILAVGLTAMIVSLPGAAALLVAAGALALLGPTMAFLGTLKWGTIFKGLASIALILGTLAIAGMIAGPGLAALGVALLPLGLAFTLVAAAAYLFATAMQKLSGEGTKGFAVMTAAITAFVLLLPKMIIDLLKGLVQVVAEVAKIAPQVVDALVKIVNALIDVVIRSTPRLALAIGTLVDGILQVIIRDSPKLIKGGITLMLNLLKGLDDYIPKAIPRIASIVTKFLVGFANAAPKLTAAGAQALIAFLKGMGDHVGEVATYATRIVLKIYGVFATLPGKLVKIAAKAIIGFLDGIANSIPDIARAAIRLVSRFLNTLSSGLVKITRIAADALIDFLNGFAEAIRDKGPEIRKAGWNVASALIDGFLAGLKDLWGKVKDKLNWLADSIPGVIKKGLSILSPSRVMREIGQNVGLGLALGIEDTGSRVAKTMQDLTGVVVAGVDLSKVKFALTSGTTDAIGNMLRETKGLKAFGQFLGNEFRDGLTGGLWDNDGRSEAQKQIDAAFDGLKLKLTENHKALREKITGEQGKLDELLNDPKKNGRAIDRVRAAIAEDQKTLALSQFRSRSLMAQLEDEKKALSDLATAYETTSKQLERAKEIFNEYKQQYNQLPEISGLVDEALSKMKEADDLAAMSGAERWKAEREKQKEEERKRNIDQVALYKQRLQEQIDATKKYMETLAKLRGAGLDDATYEKLLKQGTAGQEFASQLLAKGKAGIDEINKLDAELAKTAVNIANNAAEALYKAGEQAATGFIKGLEDQQTKIRDMMDFIANTMIKSLKFRLGIRSPSRVFAEMGRFSAQGLVDGLGESRSLVGKAATDLGNEAANALTKTLASIQNGVDTDLTITPVLDLTQIQKDASQIQDLANVTPITAAASFGQAASISTEQAAAAAEAVSAEPKVIEFNFEQNNTSPKALDEVELYRNTRNQLSQVKSALGLIN